MKIPHFKNVTLCPTSSDTETRGRDMHWWIHYMIKRKLIWRLIKAHRQKTGLKGIVFLRGHGKAHSSKWSYFDYGTERLMQDWINTHDGKFNVLLVGVCNCQNYSVHAEKSIVVHPNGSIGLLSMMKRRGGYSRIYVPNFGYVEHEPYFLKKVIQSLSA